MNELVCQCLAHGSQIRDLQTASSQPLGFLFQYTITSIAALALALYYSWRVTLVTLSTVPLSLFILSRLSAQLLPHVEAQSVSLTKASQITLTSLRFLDVVICFNGQQHELNRYCSALEKAAKSYRQQFLLNAVQIGFIRFVTLTMFVQGFWYGSQLLHEHRQTAGEILTAFWAALMAMQTIEQILPQLLVLETGRAAGWLLRSSQSHLEHGRQISQMKGNHANARLGDLEFRNVS